MTPRLSGLVFAALVAAIVVPRIVLAEASKFTDSAPVYQSEGAERIWFNVNCATATWTLLIASDTIARSTFMESTSSNTYSVCLTSGPTNVSCTYSTVGVELPPASAYTDYSKNAWYCSPTAGGTAQRIKGVRTRDKRDYGNISNPQLQ